MNGDPCTAVATGSVVSFTLCSLFLLSAQDLNLADGRFLSVHTPLRAGVDGLAILFVGYVCLKEKDGQKELADQTRKQPAEQGEVDVSAADRWRPPRKDTGRDTVTVSSPNAGAQRLRTMQFCIKNTTIYRLVWKRGWSTPSPSASLYCSSSSLSCTGEKLFCTQQVKCCFFLISTRFSFLLTCSTSLTSPSVVTTLLKPLSHQSTDGSVVSTKQTSRQWFQHAFTWTLRGQAKGVLTRPRGYCPPDLRC